MLLARTLKLAVVCGAAAVTIPAALIGCQKEESTNPTNAAAANGGGTNAPAAGPSLPERSSANAPATRPASATTRPSGTGTGPVGGAAGKNGGANGLPPLPRMTPGTMPSLPPLPPTTGAVTRPAFPSTQEFNK